MLGDSAEKSKSPFRRLRSKRSNPKNRVSFAPPLFIEPPDVELTSEGEMDEGGEYSGEYSSDEEDPSQRNEGNLQEQIGDEKDIMVEPLKPKSRELEESEESESVEMTQGLEQSEDRQSGDETPEPQRKELYSSSLWPRKTDLLISAAASEENVSRTRNGTVRNTDSFFKDDSIETKKISLTPNLLRDELDTSGGAAKEGTEVSMTYMSYVFCDVAVADNNPSNRPEQAMNQLTRSYSRTTRARMTKNGRTRSRECSVNGSRGRIKRATREETKMEMNRRKRRANTMRRCHRRIPWSVEYPRNRKRISLRCCRSRTADNFNSNSRNNLQPIRKIKLFLIIDRQSLLLV